MLQKPSPSAQHVIPLQSLLAQGPGHDLGAAVTTEDRRQHQSARARVGHVDPVDLGGRQGHESAGLAEGQDRKSTRLNSSHVATSYAVFCLKKNIEGRLS